MTKPKINIGDVVAITFDDHSEGEQHIVFEVFGVVLKRDRRSILVGSFVYPNSREIDENVVVYTILRATIQRIEILRPSTPKKSTEPPSA